MKRILIFSLATLLLAPAAFGAGADTITMDSAFGTTGATLYAGKAGTDPSTAGADQKTIGKTSTGVAVGAKTATSGYCMLTQHKSGNKEYGSSYDSTAIYMIDAVQGTPKLANPTATNSTDLVGTGWSTM
jgi:hypothetical protein